MTTLEETLRARAATFAAPLPGPSPTGQDVSYDPDFEAIAQEIAKLTSVTGGAPHWIDVVEKGADLLERRSKELRVAVWRAIALGQMQSWVGYAEGLLILEALVQQHWEGMFPPAKRP